MPLTVGQVSSVFRSYQTQARIAELNKQNNIRTVQQQADRVSVSDKARDLLEAQIRDQQTLAEFDLGTASSATEDTVEFSEAAGVLEGQQAEEAQTFDFNQEFEEVELE